MEQNTITGKGSRVRFYAGSPSVDDYWVSYLPLLTIDHLDKPAGETRLDYLQSLVRSRCEAFAQYHSLRDSDSDRLVSGSGVVLKDFHSKSVPLYTAIGQRIEPVTVDAATITRSSEIEQSTAGKNELIRYVELYLRSHQNIIRSAYRRQMPNENRLRYFVVLNEDSSENRTAIFSILNEQEVETYSDVYSVSFQFYPPNLEDRIRFDQKVILQQAQANAAPY